MQELEKLDKRFKSVQISTQDQSLIDCYTSYLADHKGRAVNSCIAYERDLQHFQSWLDARALHLISVCKQTVMQYLMWRTQQGFKVASTARLLSCIKGFYKYLLLTDKISDDPCFNLKLPQKNDAKLAVLNAQEVSLILGAADVSTSIGARDRAMLELLYATGISVTELVSLQMLDMDLGKSLLYIHSKDGKLAKQRVVPFVGEASRCLQHYLQFARGQLKAQEENDFLFISKRGLQMSRQTFWYRIKQYALQSSITKTVSPRSLRQAFAVHLLENGVALPLMQQLLGHTEIASTKAYAHVSNKS